MLLIKDGKTFHRIAKNSLIVAIAIPEQYLIVIDYSKVHIHPFTLEVTLKHDVCHLLLHHHIPGDNLPKWLDEGISQNSNVK